MAQDELDALLQRPTVVAAVRGLGVASLAVEDVLAELRSFGAVRIDVDLGTDHPYVCVLEVGDEHEHGRGRTVLEAALTCWAEVLESTLAYAQQGVDELEQFLLGPDVA